MNLQLYQVYVRVDWTAQQRGLPRVEWIPIAWHRPRLEWQAEWLAQTMEYEHGYCAYVEPVRA